LKKEFVCQVGQLPRIVSDKVEEKIKTHILCSSENRVVYEIMSKNMPAGLAVDDIIRPILIAC